jgi:preprotein translocase subunit SecF
MNTDKVINFMGLRRIAMAISVALVLGSIVVLFVRGLNFGLDFTGGTLVELHYSEPPNLSQVREQLTAAGYPGAVVVHFGSETELLVRMRAENADVDAGEAQGANIGQSIAQALQAASPGVQIELMRSEMIGAQMGDELANSGGLGLLVALIAVFIYVAIRFQTKFSVGALVALAHDVIIVLGLFSLFQLEVDLTVLAAVLAVIGYSINDTIVVADRIRENFRILRTDSTEEIINVSLTQTLGRTLMTSGTTLLVLLALFFVGGELIHNFSSALIVGIGVGTYSSIYVAAAIMLAMNLSKEDLMPPIKEGAELDELP